MSATAAPPTSISPVGLRSALAGTEAQPGSSQLAPANTYTLSSNSSAGSSAPHSTSSTRSVDRVGRVYDKGRLERTVRACEAFLHEHEEDMWEQDELCELYDTLHDEMLSAAIEDLEVQGLDATGVTDMGDVYLVMRDACDAAEVEAAAALHELARVRAAAEQQRVEDAAASSVQDAGVELVQDPASNVEEPAKPERDHDEAIAELELEYAEAIARVDRVFHSQRECLVREDRLRLRGPASAR